MAELIVADGEKVKFGGINFGELGKLLYLAGINFGGRQRITNIQLSGLVEKETKYLNEKSPLILAGPKKKYFWREEILADFGGL